MKNRFNLNEEEKNRIRGLHKITEQVVGYGEQGLDEDAGMDTPGGNPDFFYGDGSLDKLRKFAQEQDSEMSTEAVIEELRAIYSYSQDGAHDLVSSALEGLLYRLGGFRDDISGSNLNEEKNTIKEDGHMDIPSAIRKCKLILDDADDILEKLAELQEMGGELPSWWMDKVTIAADYLNKADDYINTSGKV